MGGWDSTIEYVKGLIKKAWEVEAGTAAREKFVTLAQNALDGVPDSHPEKSSVQKELNYLK